MQEENKQCKVIDFHSREAVKEDETVVPATVVSMVINGQIWIPKPAERIATSLSMGILVRKYSAWIGVHYSPYNKRWCINLLPCITIWIVKPGGVIPNDNYDSKENEYGQQSTVDLQGRQQ